MPGNIYFSGCPICVTPVVIGLNCWGLTIFILPVYTWWRLVCYQQDVKYRGFGNAGQCHVSLDSRTRLILSYYDYHCVYSLWPFIFCFLHLFLVLFCTSANFCNPEWIWSNHSLTNLPIVPWKWKDAFFCDSSGHFVFESLHSFILWSINSLTRSCNYDRQKIFYFMKKLNGKKKLYDFERYVCKIFKVKIKSKFF